jgi:hypothetical protein
MFFISILSTAVTFSTEIGIRGRCIKIIEMVPMKVRRSDESRIVDMVQRLAFKKFFDRESWNVLFMTAKKRSGTTMYRPNRSTICIMKFRTAVLCCEVIGMINAAANPRIRPIKNLTHSFMKESIAQTQMMCKCDYSGKSF